MSKRKQPNGESERWERHLASRLDEFAGQQEEEKESGEPEADKPNSRSSKKVKTRQKKPGDSQTVLECINIANRLTDERRKDVGVFEARSLTSIAGDQRTGPPMRMDFHTNFKSMSELKNTHADGSGPAESADRVDLEKLIPMVREITGDTFGASTIQEVTQRLFEQGRGYQNNKSEPGANSLAQEAFIKPTDPPWHIAKLLVQPRSEHYQPCLSVSLGAVCQAQLIASLRHPLAPDTPCQAYCTQEAYRELHVAQKYGNAKDFKMKPDFCEFCYRFLMHRSTLNTMNNNHKVACEVASRFHSVGIKGLYNKDACLQPVVLSSTAYPDGILGHVRQYNVSDYKPVMILFDDDSIDGDILDVLSIQDYLENPNSRYVKGWQEVKGIQPLNGNALLTVPQINPYNIAIPGEKYNLSVESILRDYCGPRNFSCKSALPHNSNVQIFRDLSECLADEHYLDSLDPNRLMHWSPHEKGSPPMPIPQHRIYYTLAMKVNALREWIQPRANYPISLAMLQKMRVYLIQHQPLMEHIERTKLFSDNELLQPIFESKETKLPTSALFALYPATKRYFRSTDYMFANPTVTVRREPTPLDVCHSYYLDPPEALAVLPFLGDLGLPIGASAEVTLGALLERLPEFKARYQENMDELDYHTTALKWTEPALPPANWAQTASNQEIEDWLAGVRTAVRKNFSRQIKFLAKQQSRYNYLLSTYGQTVFRDFDTTVAIVRGLDDTTLLKLVHDFNLFLDCFPKEVEGKLDIGPNGVNNTSWCSNRILVSALLRVSVAEELHELEPVYNSEIRYNLRLFAGSHTKLVARIINNPKQIETDDTLLFRSSSIAVTLYELFYPWPERETHEGCLPDFVNSLSKVNFFCETGMDEEPLNKLFYKLPDRACDTRELSDVLTQHCKANPVFYRYVCLLLELSLKGNYRHCTVATRFSRKLILEELFSNADIMQSVIYQMILDNQAMIADALAEALCFMVEQAPALKEILVELYKEWFSWRVYINMDMVRFCYNKHGAFHRARHIVYKRIDLKTSRTIFRQKESDYVIWLSNLIKKANEMRYKEVARASGHRNAELKMEADRKIDEDTRILIQLFVRALEESSVIEVKDLQIIGLNWDTLDKMNQLYDCFLAQSQSSTRGASDSRHSFSEKHLFRILGEIENSQYAILHHFISILQNYQSIYSMRIDNYEILSLQKKHLLRITESLELDEVPETLTRFCFTPFCCNSIKTTFPTRVDAEAYGHEEIAYNLQSQEFVCGKHAFQAQKGKAERPQFGGRQDERIRAKLQRQIEREEQKPKCSETAVCFFSGLGHVITTGGVKVPRAKKNKKSKEENEKLPNGAWWITPCCGKLYKYDFWDWYDTSYCCGTCQSGNDIAAPFKVLLCDICYTHPASDYKVMQVYDDEEMLTFRTMIVCEKCLTPWRKKPPAHPLKSHLRKAAIDPEFLDSLQNTPEAVTASVSAAQFPHKQ